MTGHLLGNNSPTSGANEPNSAVDALNKLVGSSTPPIDKQLSNSYVQSGTQGIPGGTDGLGTGLVAHGIDSIFNPFYVFRYAKYGDIGGETYAANYHRDIGPAPQMILKNSDAPPSKSPVELINEEKLFLTLNLLI
jgi:hypothetical protein